MTQGSRISLSRLGRIPLLIVPLLALTACAASIQSIDGPPVLEPAPAALLRDCSRPVRLPERELTQAEVEEFWLRDRQALVECGVSKEALERYYSDRDARITGSAPQS